MKEDFLHYVWKYQKLTSLELQTVKGETISILHPGYYLETAGPDFFNAQIIIGDQKWAGNIEIHVNSSDWFLHNHERDVAYNNVILHVVWEHDSDVFGPNNVEIPVLELRDFVKRDLLLSYKHLLAQKSWIYCENQIQQVNQFVITNWQERLFFERLERKSQSVFDSLLATNNDWEAVLFLLLAKNFGLNTNGVSFFKIAQSIPFAVIRKEASDLQNLEALFFGIAGLLDHDKEDTYFKDLQFRFYYLLQKYSIEKVFIEPLQFFKHRPDNFPTIRLSQLASLYHQEKNLFSKITNEFSLPLLYERFAVTTSEYWQTHYQFDKISTKKSKKLTKSFVDLLLINTIIPIQFAYAKSQGKEITEELIALMQSLDSEKNAILDKFKSIGISTKNAFEAQTLLQLKSEYCNKSRCLDCAIGSELLKQ
ncbi:DUF2851 family protein [Flavobacterium polysaccharolyticum]|uniref:DUF2851 family protein n=1 Tax=Flavobacterium polysaccharolyticum TaxID=3133148 RepID=A0ABU9NRM4_9FLAO